MLRLAKKSRFPLRLFESITRFSRDLMFPSVDGTVPVSSLDVRNMLSNSDMFPIDDGRLNEISNRHRKGSGKESAGRVISRFGEKKKFGPLSLTSLPIGMKMGPEKRLVSCSFKCISASHLRVFYFRKLFSLTSSLYFIVIDQES